MTARWGFALAIAGACVAGGARAQSVVVGPQAPAIAVLPGATVTVPIVADLTASGGASLGSVAARLTWQPGVLAFLGVGAGALGAPVFNADSAAGTLRFALATPTGAIGLPVLLTATFAVVGGPGAAGTLDVSLDELTRAGTFADLLPIGATTSAGVCVSTGRWGDLDGSGTVNSFDALVAITHAVGLPIAPHSTVNGDVDADAAVTTRDALVILSFAIELPTAGFRVGEVNGAGCPVRDAASVHIEPRGVTFAAGDRFPLSAEVRDSGGTLIHGFNLVWASADTAVVRAAPSGELLAVAPGSVQAYAAVAPGITDSITVTVGTRTVWYVDQALAAQNAGVEHGSETYPFAAVSTALGRAAAGDTVVVRPGEYGESLVLTRAVTLLGDSTPAGLPRLRPGTAPAITVGGLSGERVEVRRFHLLDSPGGVFADGVGELVLAGVVMEGIRAEGIKARLVDRLTLTGVVVQGAERTGIRLDTVSVVRFSGVQVDGIAVSAVSPDAPVGIAGFGVDSVEFDSVRVMGAPVAFDTLDVFDADWMRVSGSSAPALSMSGVAAFSLRRSEFDATRFSWSGDFCGCVPGDFAVVVSAQDTADVAMDSVTIHDNQTGALWVYGADSVLLRDASTVNSSTFGFFGHPFVKIEGVRRAVVSRSEFANPGSMKVLVNGRGLGTDTLAVDASSFEGAPLETSQFAGSSVRGTRMSGSRGPALSLYNAGTVSFVGLEVSGAQPGDVGGTWWDNTAVRLSSVGTILLDSLWLHDNSLGALMVDWASVLDARRMQVTGNRPPVVYGDTVPTVVIQSVDQGLLYGVTIADASGVGLHVQASGAANAGVTVVDSSYVGGQHTAIRSYGVHINDSLLVSRSRIGFAPATQFGIRVEGLYGLYVVDDTVSGTGTSGVWTYNWPGGASDVVVSGSRFTGIGVTGVFLGNATASRVEGNVFEACAPRAVPVDYEFENNWVGTTSHSVSGNAVNGCGQGVRAASGYDAVALTVRGNTFARGAAGDVDEPAIGLGGRFAAMTVVGNEVTGGGGGGIAVVGDPYNTSYDLRLDSNVVTGTGGEVGVLVQGPFSPPPTIGYNLIADNAGAGLRADVDNGIAATLNTVARNGGIGVDIRGTAPSTFRVGNLVGNATSGLTAAPGIDVTADSVFWGSPLGPRCDGECDPSSTGDSAIGWVAIFPYDTAFVAAAPALPPLPAPALRSVARPSSPAPRVARPAVAAPQRPRIPPGAREPRRAAP